MVTLLVVVLRFVDFLFEYDCVLMFVLTLVYVLVLAAIYVYLELTCVLVTRPSP